MGAALREAINHSWSVCVGEGFIHHVPMMTLSGPMSLNPFLTIAMHKVSFFCLCLGNVALRLKQKDSRVGGCRGVFSWACVAADVANASLTWGTD